MRTLPAGLQAHLDSGTTTLCHCWRVTLKSGERIGFTDHDRALVFDGTVFEADAGFSASQLESSLGLSVDNLEAEGALRSDRLSEARLRAGDFDHAEIDVWRVNWQDPNQRVLLRHGHLGEVTSGDGAFKAEIRGLTHLLGQTRGRLFQYGCDAELGDARCGMLLAGFTAMATVVSVENAALMVSGLAADDDWATRGTVEMTSGALAGKRFGIKRQRQAGAHTRLDLWQMLPDGITAGDTVQVVAGCDKQFATCHGKFANAINFQGFPHMPGTDFVAGFASSYDTGNDGGQRT